jgi:hypothetical protein
MSCAVASTCPSGGRRSTNCVPSAPATLKVRLERPPAISSKVNGATAPGMLASSQLLTGSREMPCTTGTVVCGRLVQGVVVARARFGAVTELSPTGVASEQLRKDELDRITSRGVLPTPIDTIWKRDLDRIARTADECRLSVDRHVPSDSEFAHRRRRARRRRLRRLDLWLSHVRAGRTCCRWCRRTRRAVATVDSDCDDDPVDALSVRSSGSPQDASNASARAAIGTCLRPVVVRLGRTDGSESPNERRLLFIAVSPLQLVDDRISLAPTFKPPGPTVARQLRGVKRTRAPRRLDPDSGCGVVGHVVAASRRRAENIRYGHDPSRRADGCHGPCAREC